MHRERQARRGGIEELKASAQLLISAIQEHSNEISKSGHSAAGPLPSEAVADAIRTYVDSYAKLTGEDLLALREGEPTEDSGAGGERCSHGGVISILTRTDHYVEDFAALLAEGRKSYRQITPKATEDETKSEVADLGDAIYEILHANEDQPPFPFPASKPIAGITWFLKVTHALPTDDEAWPAEPFEVAEVVDDDNLVYEHRYIYQHWGAVVTPRVFRFRTDRTS